MIRLAKCLIAAWLALAVMSSPVSAATLSATPGVSSVACGGTTSSGTVTCYTAGQVVGTATNDAATAGNFGQEIVSNIVSGSSVSLTNNTAANITSISLTAGDWDVSAIGYIVGAGTTNFTFNEVSISATSATRSTASPNFNSAPYGAAGLVFSNNGGAETFVIPPIRVSLSGTTTYYFVAFSLFTISTANAFGQIRARRAR